MSSLIYFLVVLTCFSGIKADIRLGVSDYQCPSGASISPHAECNKYYTCYFGEPVYLWQCSGNLVFDLIYNGCNFPELTNCGNRITPPASQNSTNAPSTSPPTVVCSSGDGFFPITLNECRAQFVTCLDGVAYATNCPSYGVFDPNGRRCVSPSNSACKNGNTPPTNTPIWTTTKTTTTTTKAPGTSTFTCPAKDGFYADPTNCSRFYECVGGFAYSFRCPNGLYFNTALALCDWPSNVNCPTK